MNSLLLLQLHQFLPLLSELMMLCDGGSHIGVPVVGSHLDRPLTLEVLQLEIHAQLHQIDRHVALVAPGCPVERGSLQSVLMVQLSTVLVQKFDALLETVESSIGDS